MEGTSLRALAWLLAAGAMFLGDSAHGGVSRSSEKCSSKSKKLTGMPVSFE